MSNTTNSINHDGDHHSVSAHYKSVAVEVVPEDLNRRVLKNAAKTSRGKLAFAQQLAWLRPLTFAATVGLSLALVLQTGVFDASDTTKFDAGPLTTQQDETATASGFDSATAAAMEQIRAAEEAARQNPGESESVAIPGDTAEQAAVQNGLANPAPPADAACTAAQRATTTRWWQCIEALESRGMTAAATREIAALFAAHPESGRLEQQ